MNERAMTGPKTANGSDERKIMVTTGPRSLLGTSSPITMPKDSWAAAARPLHRFAAMSMLTFLATAPMMQPTRLSTMEDCTIHLRPKMSDSRPTIRKPMQEPSVHTVATQLMSLLLPRSALISASVLAGSTQPR